MAGSADFLAGALNRLRKDAVDAYPGPYDEAKSFIRSLVQICVPHVESRRSSLGKLEEEDLTWALLSPLAGPRLFDVTCETLDHGNVDIYVSHRGSPTTSPAIRGEAKIVRESTFTYYFDGMGKLLDRFNSGRHRLGLMVAYCRAPEAFSIMRAYRDRLERDKFCGFSGCVDVAEHGLDSLPPEVQRTIFISRQNSGGNPMDVVHVWVNQDTRDEDEVIADLGEARGKKPRPKTAVPTGPAPKPPVAPLPAPRPLTPKPPAPPEPRRRSTTRRDAPRRGPPRSRVRRSTPPAGTPCIPMARNC